MSTVLWNGTCLMMRQPPSRVSSYTRRVRSLSPAKRLRFMASASACCAATAIASLPCASRHWCARQRRRWLERDVWCRCLDGERMHAALELSTKCVVDHPVALEPALSAESLRYNVDPEMSLAAVPIGSMPGVLMGFVHHL